MKKKLYTLIILVVCIGILAAAYFLILRPKQAEDAEKQSEAEADSAESSVTVHSYGEGPVGIAYTTEDGSEISFSSENGVWKYDGDDEFPVTQVTLNEMAKNLAEIKATRVLSGSETEELSSYGLGDGAEKVTLISKDGNKDDYIVGTCNSSGGTCYVLNEDTIYLCDTALADNCGKGLYEYLTGKDGWTPLVGVKKILVDDTLYEGDPVTKAADKYNSILLTGIADYKNREEYGFDGSQMRITMTYTATSDVTDESGVKISSVGSDVDFTFEASVKGEETYVMFDEDSLIYTVLNFGDFLAELGAGEIAD